MGCILSICSVDYRYVYYCQTLEYGISSGLDTIVFGNMIRDVTCRTLVCFAIASSLIIGWRVLMCGLN